MFFSVLRSSFGDFSLIDPYVGFDPLDENEFGVEEYRHSRGVVVFTFIIFMFQAFITFMIFMNFLIAQISNSHAEVS